MCTVTYLPQSGNAFILTSNRDEDITRHVALPVNKYQINNVEVYYPKDPKAGGTWMAHGSNGFTVCLLNGAFTAHNPTGNYKKSRGLVVLDFFIYKNQYDFIARYDFANIEPFTLIFVKHSSETVTVCELKWDGIKTYHTNYDASLPHIWSSVTLYTNDVIKQRENWFSEWAKNNELFSKDSILMFHHFGGNGDNQNDLVINRDTKKTVSICCINKLNTTLTEIVYEDVINKKIYSNKIISA